ncbi:helix-turn-helix domain-containing protein [Sphingomonas aliaeris]|uniref:helix-turn-helix domain-containing protein n=1 Tax=Sphingomonas aliaeris TaxID=2759526 RepID=UPI001CEC05C8
MAEQSGFLQPDGTHLIDIPFTQVDLAGHLGVTRQSVQRELAGLKATGSVSKRARGWLVDLSKVASSPSTAGVLKHRRVPVPARFGL